MLRNKPYYLLKNIYRNTRRFNSDIILLKGKEKSKEYSEDELFNRIPDSFLNSKLNEKIKPNIILDEELSILEQDPLTNALSDNEYNPNEYNFLDTEEERNNNQMIEEYFKNHNVNFKG